jgi:uncharacterized protein (TIGR03435 family)
MPGGFLTQRIRHIIENVPAPRISRTRIACLLATSTITCVAFAAGRLDRAQARTVQSAAVPQWQAAAGGKQTFDVASVKQNKSGPPPSGDPPRSNVGLAFGDDYSPNGGRLSVTNFPLNFFIGFAYKLTPYQTLSLRSQLPKWAATESFDIEAKSGSNPTKDQMRLMMQSLLVDRFKLAIHSETRQLPVFALVLVRSGKTGPQLLPHSSDPPCYTGPPAGAPGLAPEAQAKAATGFAAVCGVFMGLPPSVPGRMRRAGRDMSMEQVAGFLTTAPGNILDRSVLDRTGLNGGFDFTIEYTPEFNGPAPPNFQSDPTGPTFLEALQEQLGLKLVPQTGPVDVLVIDHIEEPSPN